jgi:hypothetical protein
VHAGEGGQPQGIREAFEVLGAQRIGHGTTLLEDPAVVDLVRERQVTIEACPTSNVHTGVIRSVAEHPLPRWLDAANRALADKRVWTGCDRPPAIRERLPFVEGRLARLDSPAARERAALDAVLDLLPGLDPRAEEGGISVAAVPLAAYDTALAQTVIIAAARRAGFPVGPARADRARRLAAAGASGREIPLGRGWRAEVSFGRLLIVRSTPEPGRTTNGPRPRRQASARSRRWPARSA